MPPGPMIARHRLLIEKQLTATISRRRIELLGLRKFWIVRSVAALLQHKHKTAARNISCRSLAIIFSEAVKAASCSAIGSEFVDRELVFLRGIHGIVGDKNGVIWKLHVSNVSKAMGIEDLRY